MKKITLFAMTCLTYLLSQAQGNRLQLKDGRAAFFSGMNVAWHRYGNDVGDTPIDIAHWTTMLNGIQASGGNCIRWWLFTNASTAPKFNNGLVSGLGSESVNNVRRVLDLAAERNIAVVLCLFSFDLLQTSQSGVNGANNRRMLNTTEGISACINNCITPLVTAIGNHPGILCWEIFNEPEGMTTNWGWTPERISMYDVQRFTNRAAGAIHRAVPQVLVSNGAWSFRSNSSVLGDRNYYSNQELRNAGGDQDGILDFYMVHYYDNWGAPGTGHSPFHQNASHWGLDKPILIAEFSAAGYNNNFQMSPTECYRQIYNRGYVGALSWTYTNHDGHGGLNEARTGMQYLATNFAANLQFDSQFFTPSGPNVARNKQVQVSSTEVGNNVATHLTDGNTSTRWSSLYADNQFVIIDLEQQYDLHTIVLRWEAARASAFSVQVSNDGTNWADVFTNTNNTSSLSILENLSEVGRYLRVNLNDRATEFGFSLFEIEAYGDFIFSDGPNIALFKPVSVSSTEVGVNVASRAVDGNKTTRWSSLYADNQWMQVDLQANYNIRNIVLDWETAHAVNYTVQVSDNGQTWQTIYSTQNSTGSKELIPNLNADGRYVRIAMGERATPFGFSLFEVEIYGSENIVSGTQPLFNRKLAIYPNPANDKVYLLNSQSDTWIIYSLMGNEVMQGSGDEIKTETLMNGTYILQAGNELLKFVKN